MLLYIYHLLSSPYYKEDTFNIIDNEIFQNVESGKPLLLLGDFNARTSCAPDYTSVDDNFYIDDEELNNFLNDISNLDNLGKPRERANQDKGRVNQHGVKLLNLCKGHNIYILNGRCGSDKHTGVGSGGGGKGGMCPTIFLIRGGQWYVCAPPPPPHTFNPTFLFST